MLKLILFVTGSVLCIISISCSSNNSEKNSIQRDADVSILDTPWAKAFLDSINSKFSEQISSGDSTALASHYWPDAELLLDNSEVIKGNDILNAWGSVIRMGIKEMTFSTTNIIGSSIFLIETGNYEMKGEMKNLLDRGKYVVVWEKRNGEWKLYRDIACTSLPAGK
jgi:ketosteroid isomerase-like protein